MRVYFDSDCNIDFLNDKTIAVIGYGNQGHAHAANLRDSGAGRVIVGTRAESESRNRAVAAGFEVMDTAEAAKLADILMLLAPDEAQADIYVSELEAHLKKGASLVFGHGLNIHYDLIKPRSDLDVFMVAPKGPGHLLRANYCAGSGLACLVAVDQDISGQAFKTALAYAAAIGGGRAGILETSFREECETDLFGEQVVLCGGMAELVTSAFETLVEAGYAPEMAYFECLHEVKLVTDLMYEAGLNGMRQAISNTAEFGAYQTGPRIITDETKNAMKAVLADIQAGKFTRDFVSDNKSGNKVMNAERLKRSGHQVEEVGARLRGLMPFLAKNKLIKDEG